MPVMEPVNDCACASASSAAHNATAKHPLNKLPTKRVLRRCFCKIVVVIVSLLVKVGDLHRAFWTSVQRDEAKDKEKNRKGYASGLKARCAAIRRDKPRRM